MKIFYFTVVLISLASCSTHDHDWSYYKNTSADFWGKLKEEYKACEIGKGQSPINLSLGQSSEIHDEISFSYKNGHAVTVDNGHTVNVVFDKGNYVLINNVKYFLDQLHFHAHSEHSVEGIYYPMEMHLVHRAKDNKIAVLAFFIELTNNKKNQFGFFQGLSAKNKDQTIDLPKLIQHVGAHFTYMGSLTTPPCTEGVRWIVFDQHLNLHKNQVRNFKAIYYRNYRPIQKVHNRAIYHSSK